MRHHIELRRARYLREATLRGHHLVLYEEAYPALVPSPVDLGTRCIKGRWSAELGSVVGELYLVNARTLVALDRFEECPQLYVRARVKLSDGLKAFAYLVGQSENHHYPLIGSSYRSFCDLYPTR